MICQTCKKYGGGSRIEISESEYNLLIAKGAKYGSDVYSINRIIDAFFDLNGDEQYVYGPTEYFKRRCLCDQIANHTPWEFKELDLDE